MEICEVNAVAEKMPRILLVGSTLAAGGSERVISELANAWAGKGWQVGILTLSNKDSDHYSLHSAVNRIALDLMWDSHSVWESVVSNMQRSYRLRKAVKRYAPDVVVSFIEQNNVRVLAALVGTGIRVIVSERSNPCHHVVGRTWQIARIMLYPFGRAVVVQTDSVGEWAKQFVPKAKVHIIPNYARTLPAPPLFKLRGSNEILAVGRLTREKGFDLLLSAFAKSELIKHGGRLTILGDGPEHETLNDLARRLGIAKAVSFEGVVKNPEKWMARCALFVLPSRYEGFPNALLEAMAMGCPVIAADCPHGPAELIRHNCNGLLIPPDNSDALAASLCSLMDDTGVRCRLGENAVEVRQKYAQEPILRQWENLILGPEEK